MVQRSELDPKSFLWEIMQTEAHDFVILRQKHVIFRHKASQPVDLCIFYYRLRLPK